MQQRFQGKIAYSRLADMISAIKDQFIWMICGIMSMYRIRLHSPYSVLTLSWFAFRDLQRRRRDYDENQHRWHVFLFSSSSIFSFWKLETLCRFGDRIRYEVPWLVIVYIDVFLFFLEEWIQVTWRVSKLLRTILTFLIEQRSNASSFFLRIHECCLFVFVYDYV